MNNLFKESDTTILVIDNDQLSLDIIEDILKVEGYRITTSNSTEKCCQIVEENNPDLILLDINMPGANGIETCRKLKKNNATSGIPVIFMTAINEDDLIAKAFDSGCTDYLGKPVSRTELLARLRTALNNNIMREKLLEDEKFKNMMVLAGTICHELNQPLHSIMGYADLLTISSAADSKTFRQAKIISEQAEKMGKITQQLMALTKNKTISRKDEHH